MVGGTAFGWGTGSTIILAVALVPVRLCLQHGAAPKIGLGFGAVLKLALAADTASIFIMEVVDNAADGCLRGSERLILIRRSRQGLLLGEANPPALDQRIDRGNDD